MTFVKNRKAGDYEILETFEAGIALVGQEVKSVRENHVQLDGSFVIFESHKPQIVGMKIPAFQPNNLSGKYDPLRTRNLLLKKNEILKLYQKKQEKGVSMIPLEIYANGKFIKVKIALVRGKKKYDKRETLKSKTIDRDLKRKYHV